MNIRSKLSQRIHMNDIHEVVMLIRNNNKQKQELFNLIFDSDDNIAYHATWILCHFKDKENCWLYDKQDELINEVLVCTHPGKRRLILALLYKQPLADPPRIDLLDFCLDRMSSKEELPGVQTLTMKLAYEMCRSIPELLQEFGLMLEIMEPELLPVSIRTVRKNILKAMRKGKSLQVF